MKVGKKRIAACLVALFAAATVLFAIYHSDISQNMIANSDDRAAEYEHFTFDGYPNFVGVFNINAANAQLFIELPDGRRYLLKDIPEEIANKYMPNKTDFRHGSSQPMDMVLYTKGRNSISYRKGTVDSAYFFLPKETFRFSPRLEGPYLELPADKDQLIQIFGEPLRWKRPGHMGPQF